MFACGENSLLQKPPLYSEDLHLFTFTNLHIMVIRHQSMGPHSGCTYDYSKIGSTDLNLNGCNENLCISHYEPAINIFLQQTSVFSVKCFIHEKEERKGKKIVLLVCSSTVGHSRVLD